MKTIFSLIFSASLFLSLFASTKAQASTINLNVGDSITVQANSTTTVTCGGNGATCTLPVKNLKAKFDYCKADNSYTVADCLDKIWLDYKHTYGQCVAEGFDLCLAFCKTSLESLDCLAICE